MLPSEFFELIPEVTPALLGLREADVDDSDEALALITGLVGAAEVDYEVITGTTVWPQTPTTARDRQHRAAFLTLLTAAALRLKKYQAGLDAVEIHNPDVQQNVAFNLDIVRVIGRAERGAMQRARNLIRGGGWLGKLVGSA